MIALAYAIPLGVFSGWSGVLDLILTPVHVSQVSISWLIISSCFVSGMFLFCTSTQFYQVFMILVHTECFSPEILNKIICSLGIPNCHDSHCCLSTNDVYFQNCTHFSTRRKRQVNKQEYRWLLHL